jgi:large subunit ribosomal protein L18
MATDKLSARLARKTRIRKRVAGTAERPRLTVFRSARHVYAQVVDDGAGRTLVAASTLDPELRDHLAGLKKKARAKKVGALVAARCKAREIEHVVFDRNGYLYHGRVEALAAAAREAGLKF